MNNAAVTYTNTAARVTFTFGHRNGVLVSTGSKLQYLNATAAEDFIEALVEAGYRVAK